MAPKASVHELHVEGLKFGPTYQKLPQIFGKGKLQGVAQGRGGGTQLYKFPFYQLKDNTITSNKS